MHRPISKRLCLRLSNFELTTFIIFSSVFQTILLMVYSTFFVHVDMCPKLCVDKCIHMCMSLCVGICMDLCMDMCVDMRVDTCMDMCVGMGLDMCCVQSCE